MTFSQTEINTLKLVKSAFSGTKLTKEECAGFNWDEIYEELKHHAVLSVPVDVIADAGVPDDLLVRWIGVTTSLITLNDSVCRAVRELDGLLEAENIHMGILKGLGAAHNYPNPIYRSLGDVDFLVNKDEFDRALKVMTENGYKLAYPIDHVDYHVTLEKDGVMFELHREPAGIGGGKYGEILRKLFEDCCTDAKSCDVDVYSFKLLPRLHNGLALLLHLVKHLDDGLGLRQICDWLGFVKNELNNDVWKAEFEPVLKSVGLYKIACVTTKMCKIYLGLGDDITWCDFVDDEVCDDFMRYVMDNGNFGRKNDNNKRSTILVGNTYKGGGNRAIKFLKGMQKDGINQWGAVKRFPVLKCIAWMYIPVRYITKLCTRERSIRGTVHLFKTANKKKSLQEHLAVYK